MGRFSCFYSHVPSLKQKKSAQPSFEEMMRTLQLGSQKHASASAINASTLHESHQTEIGVSNLGSGTEHLILTSHSWKSGELKRDFDAQSSANSAHCEKGNFRRSLSAGCELDQQRTFSYSNVVDCIVQESSYEGSQEIAEELSPNDAKSPHTSLPDQDWEASHSLSLHFSSLFVNHESVFSVNEHYTNKGDQDDLQLSMDTECPDGFGQITPTQSRISKCYSMPNFGSMSPKATGVSTCDVLVRHNRSFEDLNTLSFKEGSITAHDTSFIEISGQTKEENLCHLEKLDVENAGFDNYDSYSYGCSNKEWIIPMPDEIGVMRQGEHNSCHQWNDFTNKDFKIKLIEDWIIDLQHCSPDKEINEVSDSGNQVKSGGSTLLDGVDKVEMRGNPGMEAAKRYISTLNASATSAQLANHGLVAIPLLSAFVSLKALNLSGNSIVRITAGALPRGLHMLNLSKNKISTIEGLRELTRLRVLDLSYNKISRIGHGLASCSTLKELYLAGNKISEVEGLHRLLKLTVLDLRFNRIATSKCLGLLAANYNSLQAISLEGNPAQKNVGDEQLKKYLQGLLPHLAYYNRQHTKISTVKDSSDRSVRLGISERGLRSDHKSSSRRGAPKRSSHLSIHGQKGKASDSLKKLKGKHVLVPPSVEKLSHRHHHLDIDNKPKIMRYGLSLHKSRSESTLDVL